MSKITPMILAIVLFSAPLAWGRTITVAQDGSGDYEYLQEASEAAASGDTILIGPGQYGRHGPAMPATCSDNFDPSYMNILVEKITIIGAGKDATIIGNQSQYDPTITHTIGILLSGECGPRFAKISGIGFRNMGPSIYSFPSSGNFPLEGTGVIVEDCGFENVLHCVIFNGERTIIHGCDFRTVLSGTPDFVAHVSGGQAQIVEVRGCRSEIFTTNIGHVNASPSDSLVIANCQFIDHSVNGTGIVTSTPKAYFTDCSFNGGTTGIYSRADFTKIDECNFQNIKFGILFENFPRSAVISNCGFQDMTYSSISYDDDMTSCTVHHCNLDKGLQYAVQKNPWTNTEQENEPSSNGPFTPESSTPSAPQEARLSRTTIHFDMRHNYWGTDNPDSIQAWIEDANDVPEWPIIIDWEPFEANMVATEKTTLGDLRALYR